LEKVGTENIILRLKRIEGQVRGIQKMVESEADCTEIMNQVAAVKSAIARVGVIIFESHARQCLLEMHNGDNEHDFDEIITLMSRFIK
jgi:DNA-binding FrmR family transcriptional regulator